MINLKPPIARELYHLKGNKDYLFSILHWIFSQHIQTYFLWGIVHCTYLGESGYNFQKYCIILSEDLFIYTNSVDPDKMQHNAAFHLGLHCLKKYSLRGFLNTKGCHGIILYLFRRNLTSAS